MFDRKTRIIVKWPIWFKKAFKADWCRVVFVVEMYHELKLGIHFQNNYAISYHKQTKGHKMRFEMFHNAQIIKHQWSRVSCRLGHHGGILDVCHHQHNRWLCKKISQVPSVKFSNWNAKNCSTQIVTFYTLNKQFCETNFVAKFTHFQV